MRTSQGHVLALIAVLAASAHAQTGAIRADALRPTPASAAAHTCGTTAGLDCLRYADMRTPLFIVMSSYRPRPPARPLPRPSRSR